MKNNRIIITVIVAFIVLVGTSLLSESFPTKASADTDTDNLSFSGYVNKKSKPQFVWRLEKDSTYTRIGSIDIVLDTGEKFPAKFIAKENWPGANLIIHKDSYPPVKGKKINVSGLYMDDDFFWIKEAKL